jgi:hypothetical protein
MWCAGWTGTEKSHHMNAYTTVSDGNIIAHASGSAARESGTNVFDTAEKPADSTGTDSLRLAWSSPTGIRTLHPYALFNKSPMQLRLIGARGGRTYGRNLRARRALMATPPEVAPLYLAPRQTTAEAIAALDARFPWLRCAEQRRGSTPSSRRLPAHSHPCVSHEPE